MPFISDGPTVRFVREEVRPLCERARALMAEVGATKIKFDGEINAAGSPFNLGTNGDLIAENRTSEGVANLTKLQVLQAVEQLEAVLSLNSEIIQAPCVRPLEAT